MSTVTSDFSKVKLHKFWKTSVGTDVIYKCRFTGLGLDNVEAFHSLHLKGAVNGLNTFLC